MELFRTRKIEIEEKYDYKVICDKCGEEVKLNIYDAFNFDFELKTGTDFPEGGSGEIYTLDLCSNCADELVELLLSKGYKILKEDWDW